MRRRVGEGRGVLGPFEGPLLTGNVPGVGGRIKGEIEDFEVEELPLYEPSGEGGHFFLWVEKRDVDGRELLQAVGRALGVKVAEVGQAGVKDKRGVTRQWLSVPAQEVRDGVAPEPGVLAEGVELLRVERHGNKLRRGHLWGNRFRILVRETALGGAALEEAVELVGARILAEGVPNYFGDQRFGEGGSTLRAGLKWVQSGEAPRDRFLRRMAMSAVQSEVFNRVLGRRLLERTWGEVLEGDIFEKVDSGGKFWIDHEDEEEVASVRERLKGQELSVTGPLPGSRGGLAKGAVRELEEAVIGEMGLSPESFKRFGRQGRGTRRALRVVPEGLRWDVGEDGVMFEFSLPAGSYATTLLREFMEPV